MAGEWADGHLSVRQRDCALPLSIRLTARGYSMGIAQILTILRPAPFCEFPPSGPKQAIEQQSHPEGEEK
jgi:hypothetical protein